MKILDRIGRSLHHRAQKVASKVRSWLPRSPRPTILMYHRIAEESFDPWGTAVTPKHFAEHLEWLRRHRTVLPLSRFVEFHRNGSLPKDAVAITFDDGYRCNAEVAAPLLERFGLAATIFLPVEWIEKGDPYWWDELEEIALGHHGQSLSFGGREIPLGEKTAKDRHWSFGTGPRTARQAGFDRICRQLSSSRPDEVDSAMRELREQAGQRRPAAANKQPMSPGEVRELAGSLIDFGSHAMRHPWLPGLGAAEKKAEIRTSIERCEAVTGRRPTAFAYPFGILDEESERLVAEAGFLCACSTDDAPVDASSRVFALPRVQVADCSAAALERRLRAL